MGGGGRPLSARRAIHFVRGGSEKGATTAALPHGSTTEMVELECLGAG
jgi:hypothetical protein